jgi:hypothetical protein
VTIADTPRLDQPFFTRACRADLLYIWPCIIRMRQRREAPYSSMEAAMAMSLPEKPANTVFGIRVDGKPKNIGLPSIAEAEQAAAGLVSPGRKVDIYDSVTGRVVKQL